MKRVAIAALFVAGASSFAANFGTAVGWVFVAAALLALVRRVGRLSPEASLLWKRLLHLALVLAAVLGWILVIYPVLSSPTLRLFSLALGFALGGLGSLFLLTEGLPARAGAVPAAIGLLVLSAFNLEASVHPYLIAAGCAGFLTLASEVLTYRSRGGARALVLAGFALPIAATAIGIILMLPWAQGVIEEVMIAAYTPKTEGGEEHRRLGDLQSLKLSKKVVMRVYSERPQKLRTGVLVRFDGVSWHGGTGAGRILFPRSAGGVDDSDRTFLDAIPGSDFVPSAAGIAGKRFIRTEVRRVDGGGLATPGGSRLLHAPLENVHVDPAGILSVPPRTAARWYGVLHEIDHRRSQDGPLDEAVRGAALQLPERLDPRISSMGAELAQGESDPERVVEEVVAHLRESYHYSLEIGEIDPRDPLSDFLFQKRAGWCEYFATAAVILLRTRGIPARYVSGFNVIGSQKKDDYYLVREWDRHGWIEAYIEEKGWVEYDPTPAAEYESLHSGVEEGLWSAFVEWASARGSSVYLWLRHLDPLHLAAILGVGLSAFLLAPLLRRTRRRIREARLEEAPRSPPTGLEDLIARLDRRAAELGYPRPGAAAPLEHWNSLPEGRLTLRQRELGIRVLETFYRARYGGLPASRDEAEKLARLFEGVSTET